VSARLDQIRARRLAQWHAIGPRPPWWRPLRRAAWMRMARAICAVTAEEVNEILGEVYATASEKLAMSRNPAFGFGRLRDEELN
jgi:myo-inositol catabolism protein IolC